MGALPWAASSPRGPPVRELAAASGGTRPLAYLSPVHRAPDIGISTSAYSELLLAAGAGAHRRARHRRRDPLVRPAHAAQQAQPRRGARGRPQTTPCTAPSATPASGTSTRPCGSRRSTSTAATSRRAPRSGRCLYVVHPDWRPAVAPRDPAVVAALERSFETLLELAGRVRRRDRRREHAGRRDVALHAPRRPRPARPRPRSSTSATPASAAASTSGSPTRARRCATCTCTTTTARATTTIRTWARRGVDARRDAATRRPVVLAAARAAGASVVLEHCTTGCHGDRSLGASAVEQPAARPELRRRIEMSPASRFITS